MANVATMISQSGIAYGTSSCLCQFQAFLIQWSVARSDCPCLMPVTFILMVAVRMSQVHARRCVVDSCHGMQCLLDILPQI